LQEKVSKDELDNYFKKSHFYGLAGVGVLFGIFILVKKLAQIFSNKLKKEFPRSLAVALSEKQFYAAFFSVVNENAYLQKFVSENIDVFSFIVNKHQPNSFLQKKFFKNFVDKYITELSDANLPVLYYVFKMRLP
jgi:hypothetical protein